MNMALQRHEGTNIPSGKRGYRIYYRYSDRYVLSASRGSSYAPQYLEPGQESAVELFCLDLANGCVALSSPRPLNFNRSPRTYDILGIFLHRASTVSDPLECMSRPKNVHVWSPYLLRVTEYVLIFQPANKDLESITVEALMRRKE
jgi:hypothetical protein